MPYNDYEPGYNKDLHPLMLAFNTKSNETMDILGRHLKGTNRIKFNEAQFWEFMNCANKTLRDCVLGSLFNHIDVDSSSIQNIALMDLEEIPISTKYENKKMSEEKFSELTKHIEKNESLPVCIYRSAILEEWSLKDNFVDKFLKIAGQDPSKVTDN